MNLYFKTLSLTVLTSVLMSVTAQGQDVPAQSKAIALASMPLLPLADIGATAINEWSDILKQYGMSAEVTLFDYAGLAASERHMASLGRYIETLAQRQPSAMTRDQAIAYWGNLYNALTVQVVAQNWPVTSIKQIKSGALSAGPWKRDLVTVEGYTLSLNDIEHEILRKNYDEPRIHYMVNCASIGCPNLKLEAWSADSLDADLDIAARAFVNSERGASVKNGKLKLSSIYKWFKEDFGNNNAGIIAHIRLYADEDLTRELTSIDKVSSYQYDWSVNAQ